MSLFSNLNTRKKCVYYLHHRFRLFTPRRASPVCHILNSSILLTSFLSLPLYVTKIIDPIWILEIKTSDSVWRSCSHPERQSRKVQTGGRKKMENLRREKETGIYRNKKSNTTLVANVFESIRHDENAAILFSHYIQALSSI